MTTNITVVDRVVERLKAQPIGDLITEEDLHDIVKEAIPKVFFQNRKKNDGYRTTEIPPLMYEIIEEVLKDPARDAVKQWMVHNAQMMRDYWKKVIDENLMAYVQKLMDEQATKEVKFMLTSYIDRVNKERAQMGLPMIM